MTIGSGADRIELYHFGRGHTNGDTFVLFTAARLLCMGDVMAWNMAPFLPAGGAEAIAEETEALVKAVKGKVDLVEEGHGHMNTGPVSSAWPASIGLWSTPRSFTMSAATRPVWPSPTCRRTRTSRRCSIPTSRRGSNTATRRCARAHMNVNVAYTELAGEQIGFGIANGAPLPATDKHKGSDPKDTAPPTPEMLAAAVAK